MDRGLHQTLTVLFFVIGLFVIAIIYLNSTKDSTSFMIKIVSITLVTLLLLIQFLSLIFLRDQEEAYDALKREEIARALDTHQFKKSVRYVISLSYLTQERNLEKIKEPDSDKVVYYKLYKPELINTAILEEIKRKGNNADSIKQILIHSGPAFNGYYKAITNYLEQNGNSRELKKGVLKYIRKINKKNHVHYTKISMLPEKHFRKHIVKYAKKNNKGIFAPFAEVILKILSSSEANGLELKTQVLRTIAPMIPAGTRVYRKSKDGFTHYTAFTQININENKIYEVGYDYRDYRNYVHPSAWKVIILLFVILFIVLIIFPLFFRGALVSPLNKLLGGVELVNAGDLTVHVPVVVEDEIGFLAHSFNSMVRSIREAREQLEDYARNLEDKVKERTKELNNTLEQVQALKQKQDGDYFLTALLSKPLNYNANKSKRITTQFIIHQKKTFEFRKRQSELGGDICVTGNLRIGTEDNYKRYIVALNGDAMGKSMQGAGGSLVMGVVMNSIMARSAKNNRILDTTPEQWLTDIYEELHGVFLAFNGSMVISAVVDVIDEETGDMWYFNAEHPFQVIYRNGKASFIEEELLLRKIGLESEFPFKVQRFKLEPGDTIIMGSDGRDDINLTPDDEVRTINEDEYLFLESVEYAEGDLEKIIEHLHTRGELTDDLSLLKIQFVAEEKSEKSSPQSESEDEIIQRTETVLAEPTPDEKGPVIEIDIDDEMESDDDKENRFQQLFEEGKTFAKDGKIQEAIDKLKEAYELNNDVPELNKFLAILTFKNQDYTLAVDILEKYLEKESGTDEFWLYLSIAQKKNGDLTNALETAKKAYNINTTRIQNIIQLADVHYRLGETEEAKKYVNEALSLDPNNEQAKFLMGNLNR